MSIACTRKSGESDASDEDATRKLLPWNLSLYGHYGAHETNWQRPVIYRVAQNKIPHQTICNISASSGLKAGDGHFEHALK